MVINLIHFFLFHYRFIIFKAGNNGNVAVAQHLINAKVDLNIRDNFGFSALAYGNFNNLSQKYNYKQFIF